MLQRTTAMSEKASTHFHVRQPDCPEYFSNHLEMPRFTDYKDKSNLYKSPEIG